MSSTDTITWYEAITLSASADLFRLDSPIGLIENLNVPLLVSEFFSQEERAKTASRIKVNCIDLIKVSFFFGLSCEK